MIEDLELETYLSISKNKFGIYLFDVRNFKNIYKHELNLENKTDGIDYNSLKTFLDNNIYKIEKLIGKFVKNIFLIIDNEKNLRLNISIKKKNYSVASNKDLIINSLTEIKDLFKENYRKEKIMHMIVNKYLINNKIYSSYEENLQFDQFALEVEIISISIEKINHLNKILENYQINIIKYFDGAYLNNFFKNFDLDISEMAHKINAGYNLNEVIVVPKNSKKPAFFKKFFQLFS